MRNKTITIFIPNLEGGGAERVIASLANEFVDKGFKVDLLLVNATGPYLREIDEKVNIISFGVSKNIYSLIPLISYLRKFRPKVILSTLLMTNIIAVLAKKMARVNTRVILREAITASADDQFKKGNFEYLITHFRKWALKNADMIIAPSHGVSKDLVKYYGLNPMKVKVIYNPIHVDKCFQFAHEYNEILYSIPPDKKIVLAIGRLTGQKDFMTLINAFKKVRLNIDAVLVILGEGNQRKQLELLIDKNNLNDHVILPGFIVNPFPFLKRAAVFVLSSLYEGMPNSLIQAVVFQKQIVATNCPSGPFEILQGGKFGYLVNMGDDEAMALGIEKGLHGQLEKQPIKNVLELYNSNDIANKYLDILLMDLDIDIKS
ncbi:CDP-glycerol glycerophosphotransferase [Aquirufa nivalisilvae]|uniref:CDP-glycerol glycerophosphotransferase n=1 Tax=Aquirufa nivalisilvae TaxID=2516557 RepID=A0A2S2DZ94_9BACT|nr:glycosyltransferase [Aquirufa nivalisilvae]AWL10330.1 CDP-glycerol glycerophosphotransferase [Aquirufa nivalisilvae]